MSHQLSNHLLEDFRVMLGQGKEDTDIQDSTEWSKWPRIGLVPLSHGYFVSFSFFLVEYRLLLFCSLLSYFIVFLLLRFLISVFLFAFCYLIFAFDVAFVLSLHLLFECLLS